MSVRNSTKNARSVGSSLAAKILAFSAIAEIATGIALILSPAFVVTNLLAPITSELIIQIARVAGIALVALGLACWAGWRRVGDGAFRALLTYNLLIAAYLSFLGAVEHQGGVLLWPTVALHALMTVLLLFLWHADRSSRRE